MKSGKIIIIAIIAGAIAGAAVSQLTSGQELTEDERIAEFYRTETAVYVSPHGLRKAMDTGSKKFVLVDLRSQEEYEREHIIGAVSVPAYKDPETSAYGDVERIVGEFRRLEEENPEKEIIAYCYSIPCMTGRKVGKILADNGVYVKELGVGWNEWRYFWTLWNHEHEWDSTSPEQYVFSGAEPGVPTVKPVPGGCKIEGELGC
ncbi:hypothetical protein CL634_09120 [bacterium]|nr:hypothetical protein [bacterium]